jgi:hypothetical protein
MTAECGHGVRDMENDLAGLNRRYAHLHTPKHLTNPDHYEPWRGTPGPPLTLAPRYADGRPRHGSGPLRQGEAMLSNSSTDETGGHL